MELVTRLPRERWEPHVFCLGGRAELADALEQAGVPVTCLGASRLLQIATVLTRLSLHLRRLDPALLQTFLFHANIVGRLAGQLAGVQRIVSGIRVAEKRSRVPLWIDRWTNWMVDQNVSVSRAVTEFSSQHAGIKPSKVTTIPNGVDVERFADAVPADLAEFGIPPTSQTIVAVGRLDHQKAPNVLLETAERLIPTHDSLHVLFVGHGPLEGTLRRWVDRRQLGNRIHFTGWRPDVAAIMKSAYCLVLASLWEGMPNVVLEAMAAGLPVVASRVEGTRELVKPGETGLLVAPGSAAELENALTRILQEPTLAMSMANAAQELVTTRFTYNSVVTGYENLYAKLLDNPSLGVPFAPS